MEQNRLQTGAKKYKNLSDDESQIRQLLEQSAEAVKNRDVDGILACYAEDAVIYDTRDDLEIDKDGLRRSWIECFETSENYDYKIQNLHIRIEKNVAFSFCMLHTTGEAKNGEMTDMWLRLTTAFTKKYNKWLIIHEHCSVPGDFNTGKMLLNLLPELPH